MEDEQEYIQGDSINHINAAEQEKFRELESKLDSFQEAVGLTDEQIERINPLGFDEISRIGIQYKDDEVFIGEQSIQQFNKTKEFLRLDNEDMTQILEGTGIEAAVVLEQLSTQTTLRNIAGWSTDNEEIVEGLKGSGTDIGVVAKVLLEKIRENWQESENRLPEIDQKTNDIIDAWLEREGAERAEGDREEIESIPFTERLGERSGRSIS